MDRRYLRASFLKELDLETHGPPVAFQARVVPMGWSWSVHLIQAAHLNLLKGVLPGQPWPWLTDKIPSAFRSSPHVIKVLYIDNMGAIGLERGPCERRCRAAGRDGQ